MCFEVFHAVELSVTHCTAEWTVARGIQLQSGPLAPFYRLLTVLMLTLTIVPPQQARKGEAVTTGLASVMAVDVVVVGAPELDVDSMGLWRSFRHGSWIDQMGHREVQGEGWEISDC